MLFRIRKKIYSLLNTNENNRYKYECIKIGLTYFTIAFLWIYFSDRIANKIAVNSEMLLILSTYKGWLYVVITSIILYLLISRLIKKVNLAEMKFNEVNEALTASNEELEAYIQQLTTSEEELEYLSYHDQLTGLYNRRFFEEELIRLDVENSLPLSIVMADVNGLKLVNDSFGHAIGDELLKKVVQVMKNGFRKDDIIARLAGDEFIVLMPNTNINETEQIIRNVNTLASKEKVGTVDISISFGFATKNSKEDNIKDILKKAEDYMYKKKLFEGPSMRGKTIQTIVSTLHEKNKREEQHSYRVSKLCESMGIVLGLSEDEIKELKTVGLLHDIGKIAIEENILNKPGKLTDEEWIQIRRHPEIGYRILSTVNELSEMAEYLLSHHERIDGRGYPKGLTDEEIPIQSKIISIADTYDAMVSERSYRNALPEEVAIEELKRNAGSQFDRGLTRIFIEKVLNKTF